MQYTPSLLNQYSLIIFCGSEITCSKLENILTSNSPQQTKLLLIRYLYLVCIQRGLSSCEPVQRSQLIKSFLESDDKLISWLGSHSDIKQSMGEALDRSVLVFNTQ